MVPSFPRIVFVAVAVVVAALPLLLIAAPLFSGASSSPEATGVSLSMVPPYNPGGPTIRAAVENLGVIPWANLSLSVTLQRPYTLPFPNVTASAPLYPGETAIVSETLLDGTLTCGAMYPVSLQGAYESGVLFNVSTVQTIVCPGIA